MLSGMGLPGVASIVLLLAAPAAAELACRTLSTQMVPGGEIGCDVEVTGAFSLAGSYCVGERTGKRAALIPDAYGRPKRFYATLKGLDPLERVHVRVASPDGKEIECFPVLNDRAAPPAVAPSPRPAPSAEVLCDAAVPQPMLDPKAYPEHSFESKPLHKAIERAKVREGLRFEIAYAGCVDAASVEFVIRVERPKRPASDLEYWAPYAAELLEGLKTRDAVRAGKLARVARFLRSLPGMPDLDWNGDGRLSECRDGSAPDEDGCSFKTGGGYIYGARRDGRAVELKITAYVTL